MSKEKIWIEDFHLECKWCGGKFDPWTQKGFIYNGFGIRIGPCNKCGKKNRLVVEFSVSQYPEHEEYEI